MLRKRKKTGEDRINKMIKAKVKEIEISKMKKGRGQIKIKKMIEIVTKTRNPDL